MNRTIALFLALAVLFAHTLAIYTNANGNFAPPYDIAHVAFRVARNWVQTGSFAWNPESPAGESYPSVLWVGVAAIAERFHSRFDFLQVTTFCQTVGIVSALLTVLLIAKFSPGRLAGVIAPLLMVVSGPIAAAAGSGTEMTFAALFMTLAFLAHERGWRTTLAVSMVASALIRSECALFCAALFAFEMVHSVRHGFARERLAPYLAPFLAFVGAALLRWWTTDHFVSPAGEEILHFDIERVRHGGNYLRDFMVASGGPALIVIPLWYGLRGVLGGIGLRALLLSLFWCLMLGWMGGGPLPFFARFVPILPIWFVAIQEGVIVALDSKRRGLPEAAWTLFMLGLASSALASKYPGDLGPFHTEALHRAWMQTHTTGPFGYNRPLGRLGLAEEIAATERLRALGIFLRDGSYASDTILTAWPGATGYLSRLRVDDVLGRATPPPGSDELRSWTSLPRADVVAALKERPSYIVPMLNTSGRAPSVQNVAEAWAKHLDLHPDEHGRSLEILELLREYELFTVSLGPSSRLAGSAIDDAFYLLRRKDLGLAPKVSLAREGRAFRVEVQQSGHEQLVDLRVQLIDAERHVWTLKPDGTLARDATVLARRSILLFPTGTRTIRMLEFELPSDEPHAQFVELHAELRNPHATGEGPFSEASAEVSLTL